MDRNKGHYRKNVADDIATVQTMLCGFHDHPFMQEIVQIKGKPASVILYLEDNLKEIQQFCTPSANHPSVVGIDRTFNLGACFAATLVYHHKKRNFTELCLVLYTYTGTVFTPHIIDFSLTCRAN